MRLRITITVAVVGASLAFAACNRTTPAGEKVIKTAQAADTTVTLLSDTGEIKSGRNDLLLTFTDAAGKPVDVPAASLKFNMPAMGTMAEMNDIATLTTTDTPGKFAVRVEIEVGGSWEAIVNFQNAAGIRQATMNVMAK